MHTLVLTIGINRLAIFKQVCERQNITYEVVMSAKHEVKVQVRFDTLAMIYYLGVGVGIDTAAMIHEDVFNESKKQLRSCGQ